MLVIKYGLYHQFETLCKGDKSDVENRNNNFYEDIWYGSGAFYYLYAEIGIKGLLSGIMSGGLYLISRG